MTDEERRDAFLRELNELCKKYQCSIGEYTNVNKDGTKPQWEFLTMFNLNTKNGAHYYMHHKPCNKGGTIWYCSIPWGG